MKRANALSEQIYRRIVGEHTNFRVIDSQNEISKLALEEDEDRAELEPLPYPELEWEHARMRKDWWQKSQEQSEDGRRR